MGERGVTNVVEGEMKKSGDKAMLMEQMEVIGEIEWGTRETRRNTVLGEKRDIWETTRNDRLIGAVGKKEWHMEGKRAEWRE